jgi:putative membrane protein
MTRETTEPVANRPSDSGQISVELAERRTGMSFQRTRMSADRTLMSVIRTSLSLISFGVHDLPVFQHLKPRIRSTAARRSPLPARPLFLGVRMLALGIMFHVAFMVGLRGYSSGTDDAGLIHAGSAFPPYGVDPAHSHRAPSRHRRVGVATTPSGHGPTTRQAR